MNRVNRDGNQDGIKDGTRDGISGISEISLLNETPMGVPMEGFGYNGAEYPYGLEIATAVEARMKRDHRNLTETEREHIILECMDARSEREVDKIIKEKVPDGNVYSLFERNEIS